ncbi:MAG TPA: ATP-grasp domain-containing protein [Actinophytocola sp.]|uniref:ATP-grasp domain-containing protein n=1 Tax=Actinophytocola sp. TaxID=1872138 RepID=UPI002DDC9C39|nr:ATP-grasp domain-containing protein [Actinophytocola sp.]HEV2781517.1 ATP-grasp domain-containing protein [Actinophytocola sp.]
MGGTILVVDTNSAGNGTEAMRLAKTMGFRTHFLCRQPSEYDHHEVNPVHVADEVSVVETFDPISMLRVVAGRTDYAAVLAFDELRVVQAALVAQYLGLAHHPPVSALLRVRYKDQWRQALEGTRWEVAYSTVGLSAESCPLAYPCVVKPVDEAAGVGVTMCRDEADFGHAMRRLRAVTGRPNGRGYRLLPLGIVEEVLPGEEFSAELVWSAAREDWELIGFTTKELFRGRFPVEVGHVFPHRFEPSFAEHILAELRACLHTIGLRHTLVHAEFRVHQGKVFLIEINPRPAGNRIHDLVGYVLGIGLVDLHLAAHLGEADALLRQARPHGCAGIRFLLPERAGTVSRIDVTAEDDDPMVDVRVASTPRTVGAELSNESYLGHVLAKGWDRDDVDRVLSRHITRIRPRYMDAVTTASPGA